MESPSTTLKPSASANGSKSASTPSTPIARAKPPGSTPKPCAASHALTGAKCISIYPYQIGQNNDEAIDSRRLLVLPQTRLPPRSPRSAEIVRKGREENRRQPEIPYAARTLKRLAEAHMFYELNRPGVTTTDTRTSYAGRHDFRSCRKRSKIIAGFSRSRAPGTPSPSAT